MLWILRLAFVLEQPGDAAAEEAAAAGEILAEVPVLPDSSTEVGTIEMANWVDVDPLNGIDVTDLLKEVPSAVRMARHAGPSRGSQADRADLGSGTALSEGMALLAVE